VGKEFIKQLNESFVGSTDKLPADKAAKYAPGFFHDSPQSIIYDVYFIKILFLSIKDLDLDIVINIF